MNGRKCDGSHHNKEEQRAIKALQRLANKWPETLILFSWSGSLVVMKELGHLKAVVGDISGIRNDGGDPNYGDDLVCENKYEIVYE